MKNKTKILVILGPTAVGKSDIAVQIAKDFNGEIISADSRQVYKGLDIGTGKITKDQMQCVPHHLLDVADANERFTAIQWKSLAEKAIQDIHSRKKLPIVCGGTGFYITSLIDNLGFPEVPANTERQKELESKTAEELFMELKKLDPKRAGNIDQKNKRRLARAIIIAETLGEVPEISTLNDSIDNPYDALQIGIILPDEELKTRIHKRLIKRMEEKNETGIDMLDEAKYVHNEKPSGLGLSFERMDELGLEYRYLGQLLQEKMSVPEFINVLSTKIWQYARRQKTWWKKDSRIKWFSPKNISEIENTITGWMNKQ